MKIHVLAFPFVLKFKKYILIKSEFFVANKRQFRWLNDLNLIHDIIYVEMIFADEFIFSIDH